MAAAELLNGATHLDAVDNPPINGAPQLDAFAAAALEPKQPELGPSQNTVVADEIDAVNVPGASAALDQLQHSQTRPSQARHQNEAARYDYEYTDREDMDIELNDWYSHQDDFLLLRGCRIAIASDAAFQALLPWHEADPDAIVQFIKAQLTLGTLEHVEAILKRHAIATLFCIAQGLTIRWIAKEVQNNCIRRNVFLLFRANAYAVLVDMLRTQFDLWFSVCDEIRLPERDESLREATAGVHQLLTVLYFMLEAIQPTDNEHKQVAQCPMSLIGILLDVLARPRGVPENCDAPLPMRQIALLLRKAMLVTYGEQLELLKCKRRQREKHGLRIEDEDPTTITASVDEYAQFRAEIASKYPSFKPSSLIDDHINLQKRSDKTHELPTYTDGQWSSTPAPSPPPSPRGRKGIFQTDQALPFPLPWNETLQNKVPKSVEEAALMFHDRQRRTVAQMQLEKEEEALLRYDRGWVALQEHSAAPESTTEEDDILARIDNLYEASLPNMAPALAKLVDTLFNFATHLSKQTDLLGASPQANGFNNGVNGQSPTHGNGDDSRNLDPGPEDVASVQNWLFGDHDALEQSVGQSKHSPDEQAAALARRNFHILLKGVSGFILSLLRWLRVSHVLKFEYAAACLMDGDWVAVYHQAMLTLDPLQSLEASSSQLQPVSFYAALQMLPENDLPTPPEHFQPGSDSHGVAIWQEEKRALNVTKLRRKREYDALTEKRRTSPWKTTRIPTPRILSMDGPGFGQANAGVNEKIPAEPVSSRILYCAINLCKILHKCTKKKVGRAHVLLQHRIWLHLRRPLRVPQRQLQEVVLKLYKTQVPLCSRKWRSTNMRVITQIYMACKPELRDDWISGGEYGGVMSGFAASNAAGVVANGQDLDLSEAKAADDRLQRLVWFHNRRLSHKSKNDKTSSLNGHIDTAVAPSAVIGAAAYEEESEEEDFFERELNKRFAAMPL